MSISLTNICLLFLMYNLFITYPNPQQDRYLRYLHSDWDWAPIPTSVEYRKLEGEEVILSSYQTEEEAEEMRKYVNSNYAYVNIRVEKEK